MPAADSNHPIETHPSRSERDSYSVRRLGGGHRSDVQCYNCWRKDADASPPRVRGALLVLADSLRDHRSVRRQELWATLSV